jgi:hypothetical protein
MTVPFCGWFAPQSNNNTAAARWHITRLQTRGLRGFHADYASITRLPVRAASRNLISICPRVRTARHGFRPGAHPRALRGWRSAHYQLPRRKRPRRKLPRRKLPRATSARRCGTSERRGVSQLGWAGVGSARETRTSRCCSASAAATSACVSPADLGLTSHTSVPGLPTRGRPSSARRGAARMNSHCARSLRRDSPGSATGCMRARHRSGCASSAVPWPLAGAGRGRSCTAA